MKTLSLFGDNREVILTEIAEEFGSPRLSVELVPKQAWGRNLWTVLWPRDWNRLRKRTSESAHRRCEICGGVGAKWPVACHERWEFEEWSCTQYLIGLIALCPACHDVKHIGRAIAGGRRAETTAHLCAVNRWSRKRAGRYLKLAFAVGELRNRERWYVDLSWLKQFNIRPRP
jgi:hypothetical protein